MDGVNYAASAGTEWERRSFSIPNADVRDELMTACDHYRVTYHRAFTRPAAGNQFAMKGNSPTLLPSAETKRAIAASREAANQQFLDIIGSDLTIE